MSNVQQILMQQPEYIDMRRREYSNLRTAFSRQLASLLMYAPAPTRILDLTTGEWSMKHDPKWQSLIERLTTQFNEMVEKNFSDIIQTNGTIN